MRQGRFGFLGIAFLHFDMKKPPQGLLPLEVEPLSILFITPFYHVNTGTQENYGEVFLRDFISLQESYPQQ